MEGMETSRARWWTRRRTDDEDREFSTMRSLLVLVSGPTGVLLAGAMVASEDGDKWWPWLVGAVLWLFASGALMVAVWWRMASRPRR